MKRIAAIVLLAATCRGQEIPGCVRRFLEPGLSSTGRVYDLCMGQAGGAVGNAAVTNGMWFFDGTGDYLQLGTNSNPLAGATSFTICAWYKWISGSSYRALVYHGNSSGTSNNFGFEIQVPNNFYCDVTNQKYTNRYLTSLSIPAAAQYRVTNGLWHFSAFRWGGGTNLSVYHDGSNIVGSVTTSGVNPPSSVQSAFQPPTIGSNGAGAAGEWWNGYIDGVRFFRRALTDRELDAIRISTRPSHYP